MLFRSPEPAQVAAIDVSFISLRQVLPRVRRLLVPGGDAVPLVKPQFEAGRGKVGKKGVVRDPAVWREVLETVLAFALDTGWSVHGVIVSPIKGPAGNVEFLAHLSAGVASRPFELDEAVERVIGQAVRSSPGSPADLG